MDLLNTQSFTAFCLAGSVFCMSQLACAQQDAGALVEQLPLSEVVYGLADFKTFRMTSAQFDTLVAPYCKKV